jgi:uncharacterized membrane protein
LEDEPRPPTFGEWGELFVDGIQALVIGIVYLLVPGVVGMVTFGGSAASMATGTRSGAAAGMAGLAFGMVLTFILTLVFGYVAVAAIVNFAKHRQIDTIVAEHERLRLRSRILGDPIDWVVRHAPCDVLLVDNLGYDGPADIAISGDGGPYPPLAVKVAGDIAEANGGSVSLWHPGTGTDEQQRTVDDYQAELSDMLTVPVHSAAFRTDGGAPPRPDLLVRRGADHRIRNAVLDDGPTVPNPGCTTVTVHPHASRRPSLARRLGERLTF